jgi:hypothetical protein
MRRRARNGLLPTPIRVLSDADTGTTVDDYPVRIVELVLCGHVHRQMLRRWAGTVACTCPSTTTEIALQLHPLAHPRSYFGPRGCMRHLFQEEHGFVRHVSQIGKFTGPYPFA